MDVRPKPCKYPAAMDRAREVLKEGVSYVADCYEAAEGSDALLVLTDWEDFSQLDLKRIKRLLKYPIFIDGRNLYSRQAMLTAGLTYISVGRSTLQPIASTEQAVDAISVSLE